MIYNLTILCSFHKILKRLGVSSGQLLSVVFILKGLYLYLCGKFLILVGRPQRPYCGLLIKLPSSILIKTDFLSQRFFHDYFPQRISYHVFIHMNDLLCNIVKYIRKRNKKTKVNL